MQKSKLEVIALIEKVFSDEVTTPEQVDKICTQIYESVSFGTAINDIIFFGEEGLSPTEIYELAKSEN